MIAILVVRQIEQVSFYKEVYMYAEVMYNNMCNGKSMC